MNKIICLILIISTVFVPTYIPQNNCALRPVSSQKSANGGDLADELKPNDAALPKASSPGETGKPGPGDKKGKQPIDPGDVEKYTRDVATRFGRGEGLPIKQPGDKGVVGPAAPRPEKEGLRSYTAPEATPYDFQQAIKRAKTTVELDAIARALAGRKDFKDISVEAIKKAIADKRKELAEGAKQAPAVPAKAVPAPIRTVPPAKVAGPDRLVPPGKVTPPPLAAGDRATQEQPAGIDKPPQPPKATEPTKDGEPIRLAPAAGEVTIPPSIEEAEIPAPEAREPEDVLTAIIKDLKKNYDVFLKEVSTFNSAVTALNNALTAKPKDEAEIKSALVSLLESRPRYTQALIAYQRAFKETLQLIWVSVDADSLGVGEERFDPLIIETMLKLGIRHDPAHYLAGLQRLDGSFKKLCPTYGVAYNISPLKQADFTSALVFPANIQTRRVLEAIASGA